MIFGTEAYFNSLSDIKKIRRIRNYLMKSIPFSESLEHYNVHHELPFMKVLELALKHELGLQCGGHAYLFSKICNTFNISSISIDFGIENIQATHVMSVVKIQYDNENLLILIDPYTGVEFFNKNGKPFDFKEMVLSIKKINNNYVRQIYFLEGEKYILDEDRYEKLAYFQSFKLSQIESWLEHLIQNEYEAPIFFYLLLPINIGGENSDLYDEILDFFQKELGISYLPGI